MSDMPGHTEGDKPETVSVGGRKTVTSFLILIGTAVALLLIIRFLIL